MAMSDWNQDNFLESIASRLRPQAAGGEHRAQCPACRDLQGRLEKFDAPGECGDEAAWLQAEARVNHRLRSFLAAEAAVRRRGSGAVGHLRWVLVPAAALVLAVGAFLAGRISVRRLPLASQKIARAPGAEPEVAEAARSVPPLPGGVRQPAMTSAARGRAMPPASQTATVAAPVPAAPPPGAVVEPAPMTLSSTPVRLSSVGAPAAARSAAPRSGAMEQPGPPVPARRLVRIDAGTRVWIALRSVRPGVNGASQFRGVALLPVTQSGVVLFGRNTEVYGTMTQTNGKRSVKILEFRSPEAHYTLRGASGEADLRLLGAGEVVEFDAGRVLETWMASGSTYENLPGAPAPPQ